MKNASLLVLAALALCAQTANDGPQFNAAGQLQLPKNYREWIYLSSGLGMTYGPAAPANTRNPAFDNVFVNPSSYRAFVETGHWPDKTMFVLEVRNATEHGSINKGGHFQSDIRAIEAEVKDEKRFPRNWAWFSFGKGEIGTMNPPTSSCNQCHEANAAVETTFVQFYPTLLDIAKQKGTLNPAYIRKSTEATPGH